ncbi:MAG: hypothetical protein HQL17_00020 [Candidatus Omnitrophica bacterium]|nr:hypothetical protein [Candidatus Omnitrophota bacterium]
MAKNDIRSRTVTFMATQSAILGVIMLAFVILASALFVKNATRWQLRNIEDDVLMFAKQAARSGEVPKRGDLGAYTLFVLTQDGKYVLPRLPRSDDSENLWQEYEHKLVYEMQKRRDGWIFYPDRGRMDMSEGQYVIRYVYLEQQGWIVAVEGYVSSGWSMLRGFLTPKLFLGLFAIVALAFGMMLLSAFWHIRKVMKAILKAQENNFIAAPAKAPSEAAFMKREESTFSDGVINGASTRALPKARPEPFVPLEEPRDEMPPSLSERAPRPRQLDNMGEITIDTTDIRSPLLKKAIEQMREKK